MIWAISQQRQLVSFYIRVAEIYLGILNALDLIIQYESYCMIYTTDTCLWISILRTPIQAALKNNIFLSHRLYAVIGIFSLLGNIILLFTDFTLFWMEIAFLIYHISISNPDKSHSGFISDNFIFPGCFISFLFATSVGIFFLSIIVEKKLQSFLFDKFKSRMDKSHESSHHQPIQQLDVDIPELRDFV